MYICICVRTYIYIYIYILIYVYIYIRICIYVYVYTYIYIYIYTHTMCISLSVCIDIFIYINIIYIYINYVGHIMLYTDIYLTTRYIHIHIYVYVYIYIYIYVYVCMYVRMYVCIYVCIYVEQRWHFVCDCHTEQCRDTPSLRLSIPYVFSHCQVVLPPWCRPLQPPWCRPPQPIGDVSLNRAGCEPYIDIPPMFIFTARCADPWPYGYTYAALWVSWLVPINNTFGLKCIFQCWC